MWKLLSIVFTLVCFNSVQALDPYNSESGLKQLVRAELWFSGVSNNDKQHIEEVKQFEAERDLPEELLIPLDMLDS